MTPQHCPHCGRLVRPATTLCPHCGITLNPHAVTANPIDRAAAAGSFLRRLRDRHPGARLLVILLVLAVLLGLGWALVSPLLR